MVSGLEFLAMFSHAVQMESSHANLPSSGTQNMVYQSTDSVMEARSSEGVSQTPGIELHHPRPVYKAQFTDAIERFEKVAQTMGNMNEAPNKELFPDNTWGQSSFGQHGSAKARSGGERSALSLVERIIAPPKKATIQKGPGLVYRSHDSLAPPISFHYSHSMWAPCPEGQWPSFKTSNTIRAAGPSGCRPLPAIPPPPLPRNSSLKRGLSNPMNDFSDTTVRQPEPQPAQDWSLRVPSSIRWALDSFSAEASQPEQTQAASHSPIFQGINGNADPEERRSSGGDGDDTSELEYISEIFDEEDHALENATISFLHLDNDSEARDEDDDSEEYYTASEYSEYSEQSEGANADGGVGQLALSRLVPSAYAYRSDSSSTGSSALYGYIPSVEWVPPAGSTNSETRVPSDHTYDKFASSPSPTWWMKAIPGHKFTFLSAVEKSKRKHAQAWRHNLQKAFRGAAQRAARCWS